MQRKTTLNEVVVVLIIIWMLLFVLFLAFTEDEPSAKRFWDKKYPANSEASK